MTFNLRNRMLLFGLENVAVIKGFSSVDIYTYHGKSPQFKNWFLWGWNLKKPDAWGGTFEAMCVMSVSRALLHFYDNNVIDRSTRAECGNAECLNHSDRTLNERFPLSAPPYEVCETSVWAHVRRDQVTVLRINSEWACGWRFCFLRMVQKQKECLSGETTRSANAGIVRYIHARARNALYIM